jgi:hypothetical protein
MTRVNRRLHRHAIVTLAFAVTVLLIAGLAARAPEPPPNHQLRWEELE